MKNSCFYLFRGKYFILEKYFCEATLIIGSCFQRQIEEHSHLRGSALRDWQFPGINCCSKKLSSIWQGFWNLLWLQKNGNRDHSFMSHFNKRIAWFKIKIANAPQLDSTDIPLQFSLWNNLAASIVSVLARHCLLLSTTVITSIVVEFLIR